MESQIYSRKNGVSSNKLLLCLHGNSCDSGYFNGLLNGLTDWQIVAPDFQGHGQNTHLPPKDYSVHGMVNDVLHVLEQCQYSKLVVLGHSMGGNVAIELLLHTKVDTLILHASLPISIGSGMLPYTQLIDIEVSNDIEASRASISGFLSRVMDNRSLDDYLTETMLTTDPAFRARLLEEFGQGAFSDQVKALQDWSGKAFLQYGDKDGFLNMEFYETIKPLHLFESAVAVAGCGHFPLMESFDESMGQLLEMLNKLD